jgi:hypothetical protein
MPKRQASLGGQGRRQHLQKSVAVLHGPMALMKPAALRQKIAQLRPFKAKAAPCDLGMRAGPSLDLEGSCQALTERPVEAGGMGNDQVGWLDEALDSLKIERLASHQFWRDPGQTGSVALTLAF